jgi:ligand-binding sensor domain-containing protein
MDVMDGNLWLVPGGITGTWNNTWRTARVFNFIDEQWNVFDPWNTPALDSLRDMVAVTIDPMDPGKVYASSWSRGLVEFTDEQFTTIFDLTNSSFNPHMTEGVPVAKIGQTAFDNEHNLWVVNSGAENILSVRYNDGTWQDFNLGTSSQGVDVMKIIVDSYNQKWLVPRTTATNSNYIFVFDENGTGGKTVRALRSGSGFGNLPGTTVFAVAEDLEGEVWVGTDEGIAVFYNPGGVISENADAERILVDFDGYVQYLLETETVKAIAVDGANRKWIGTERAGVFLLSSDGQDQIYNFTEENSPLLSNNITCITINDDNGEVFFGTAKGLISYRGTATPGGPTNSDVYAYPNPVKKGYTGVIAIKGLVQNASVKITDVNGQVVYETRAEGGQAIWDGYNFDGRKANSGVYMVFITDSDGSEKMVTKILFLN